MSVYNNPPIFVDNVGQLISEEDLAVIRSNVGYVELLSYRLMPGFPSSGGIETQTAGRYPDRNSVSIWFGNLRFITGMTTLTITGTASGYGSAQLKVYVNGVLRITISPTATWSGTWAMSGFASGEVMALEVRATTASGNVPTTAKFVITQLYGSPVVYSGPAWPGVPTFTDTWNAAKLNQLSNAATYILNSANAVPVRGDMADLFALGPFFDAGTDPWSRRPIYYGSIGKWFSNSQFRMGGQVYNGSSPGLQMEIEFNGTLVYTSSNFAIGTTNLAVVLSLAAYSVGDVIQVAIFGNCTSQGAGPYTFSRWTVNAARSEVDTSAVYSSLPTTPIGEVVGSATAMATYLNGLSTCLLASYTRMQATPAIFNRSWALRRWFSKTNDWSDTGRQRGRPRFVRLGDRLIVRGKGVDLVWGPMTVANTDKGLDFDGYSFLNKQNVIDTSNVQTQVVYLDSLAGLYPGSAYYLLGDVSWAEESVL